MSGTKRVAQVLAVAVGLRAMVALVKALMDRWNRWDGLDSVVSFSSRMIAASRAVETQEEHALVRDPLARALAGSKAFASSLARSKDAPTSSGRRKQIGMMSIRTRWFDDQIMAALGLPVSKEVPTPLLALASSSDQGVDAGAAASEGAVARSSGSQHAVTDGPAAEGPRSASAEHSGMDSGMEKEEEELTYVVDCSVASGEGAPRQVVLLGAGMDSRPWRLDLPAGVKWFEVDRQDVLNAKAAALEAMGAQLSHDHSGTEGVQAQQGQQGQAPNSRPAAAGNNGGGGVNIAGKGPDKGAGKGASYAHSLRAASWEGVACDLCSPGWVQQLAKAGFDPAQPTVWVAEGLLMYFTQEEAEAVLQEMAGASAPGSMLIAVSITDETLAGIQQRNQSSSTLTSTWKFGCPRDPREFLARLGWRLHNVLTRGQMARCLKLDPALCAFKLEKDTGSIFFVASTE